MIDVLSECGPGIELGWEAGRARRAGRRCGVQGRVRRIARLRTVYISCTGAAKCRSANARPDPDVSALHCVAVVITLGSLSLIRPIETHAC